MLGPDLQASAGRAMREAGLASRERRSDAGDNVAPHHPPTPAAACVALSYLYHQSSIIMPTEQQLLREGEVWAQASPPSAASGAHVLHVGPVRDPRHVYSHLTPCSKALQARTAPIAHPKQSAAPALPPADSARRLRASGVQPQAQADFRDPWPARRWHRLLQAAAARRAAAGAAT